ncbi:ferritin light chain-like [Neodiprion pinetum]|uniref:ferritin light chain-like n=1 Tax=Neodiprion pinetum TaxID=441929 RepID=UPI001EDD8A37|nr:ferritin, lower subunit-like [Neodiprion pinetum]
MKVFVVLSTLMVAASATYCYRNVNEICSKSHHSSDVPLKNCNATYGHFDKIHSELEQYANAQIEASFKYLLMSSYFGNFMSNRDGFKGFYRKLSDQAWDDAKDLINFITQRGGNMNFNDEAKFWSDDDAKVLQIKDNLSEFDSMSNVLDNYKKLADEALKIHAETAKHTEADGSVAHYLEERFFNRQAKTVHTLAGYVNDLKRFFSAPDASLAVFLFDEYLQTSM